MSGAHEKKILPSAGVGDEALEKVAAGERIVLGNKQLLATKFCKGSENGSPREQEVSTGKRRSWDFGDQREDESSDPVAT